MFGLDAREEKIFRKLNTPRKIQDFLEEIPANFEKGGITCLSPRRVLREKCAHCLEGALFAAAVIWYHGGRPLLLDLVSAFTDRDHVVALFKERGYWGAFSKANHGFLRYRDPVYRTVRELAMSYFNEYFMDSGRKTLRSFSKPFNLRRYKKRNWITAEKNLWYIAEDLDKSPHEKILTPSIIKSLRPADSIEIKLGKISQWKR